MDRISIGFAAGQVLSLRVEQQQLADLLEAVTSGRTWHDVDTEEGPVKVRLDEVVYVRGETKDSRVGFGL